ncbi:MAG: autotransporter outer membrane beta-barrel domain-containing protein, partial [Anaerobiospirillum sp.]|nr:autotransporter outer membrane beta-barrel domain-containing protein [Anaerobiospirillum sp.]
LTPIEPPVNNTPATKVTGSSSFLNEVVTASHGAPAEQAARLAVYGGAAQVGLAAANSNSDILDSRFGIGANAQSLNVAQNGMGGTLWVAPIYKSQDSDGFDAQGLDYGVDFDLYGVALGGDYKVTNEITVGAMFNVGSGSLDGQGNTAAAGTSNDFDYFGFALYGAYQAGALTVTGDLSYTQIDNDLEGSNQVGKLTASSDTSAWSLGVTGQYQFTFASVDVTPHAGLRFTSLDLDDYSLEAAGHGTVANYDGDTMSVFSIPVGVTFAKSFEGESWTVTPALDLHVTGQFGDDEAEGSVAWTGTNLSTSVTSEVFDNFTYGATLGVEAQSNSFSFGVGVGYTGSSNVDEFGVNANARFTF